MNHLYTYKLSILLALLFCFSCREEINEISDTPIEIDIPTENIISSVYGKITNETNQAMQDVVVTIGSVSTQTDEDGFFYFSDIPMNKLGTLIGISTDGYFEMYKMVNPTTNSRSYIQCRLMPRTLSSTLASSTGGTATTNGNATIELLPNSFIDANDNPYNGTVSVFAKWLDPSAIETLSEMPGDLRAVDQTSTIVQLATYGMLAVELEGENGEKLNIDPSKKAQLTFPIPLTLLDSAPENIPLWTFNESVGYWIQEGSAHLENGTYVGEVSHFSFWNCDVPYPLITLNGHVEDDQGNPLQDYKVQIILVNGGVTAYDYTDNLGDFGGFVPANEVLEINIFDLCGSIIHTESIGPFSIDTTLPDIVTTASINNIQVVGYLTNCQDEPVQNGYMKVSGGSVSSQILFVDATGYFNKTVSTCGATSLDYQGVDLDALLQSDIATATISGSPLDLQTTKVCDQQLDEFFYFDIDGSVSSLDSSYAQITATMGNEITYALSGQDVNISGFPTISVIVDNGLGTYTPEYVLFFDENISNNIASCSMCDNFTITFTKLSTVSGESIAATFEGTLDLNGNDVFVQGAMQAQLF